MWLRRSRVRTPSVTLVEARKNDWRRELFAHSRVERGAALLDQHIPGWAQFIDVSKLDLERSDSCVLGQLYSGEYEMGEAVIFGRDRSRFRANLSASWYGFDSFTSWDYGPLTREWARLIHIRQYDSNIERACPALRGAWTPAG